jgi:uncharacterized membrane protein
MNIPPIHPVLVHLPIAFITLSVGADLVARLNRREHARATLRQIGFWSLVLGLVGGALTIAAGYLDMNRAALNPETHAYVDLHLKIGWALAIALAVLTFWRWSIRWRGQLTIGRAYLTAAFLVLALVFFQGWYGGELVYSHGAGVAAAGQGTEPAEAAQNRLATVHDFLAPGTAIGGAESTGGMTQNTNRSSGARQQRRQQEP